MPIFDTNSWNYTEKERLKQLEDFLTTHGNAVLAVKKPIFSLGIQNPYNTTFRVKTAENKEQPWEQGDFLKCNFNYDTETKKCKVLLYTNKQSSFQNRNRMISESHANIFQNVDQTLRQITLPKKGENYPLPWDQKTILKGNPETHVLVSYKTENGDETYPIERSEFTVTHLGTNTTTGEDLKTTLEFYVQTQNREIKTLEKIKELLLEKIEEARESGSFFIDTDEMTRLFNERNSKFLEQLVQETFAADEGPELMDYDITDLEYVALEEKISLQFDSTELSLLKNIDRGEETYYNTGQNSGSSCSNPNLEQQTTESQSVTRIQEQEDNWQSQLDADNYLMH